jgi:flagellar biosynthesis protein FliQ
MELIIGLVIIVVVIFVIRLFGAWMLRIDEVIKYQKEILAELKKGNTRDNIK